MKVERQRWFHGKAAVTAVDGVLGKGTGFTKRGAKKHARQDAQEKLAIKTMIAASRKPKR